MIPNPFVRLGYQNSFVSQPRPRLHLLNELHYIQYKCIVCHRVTFQKRNHPKLVLHRPRTPHPSHNPPPPFTKHLPNPKTSSISTQIPSNHSSATNPNPTTLCVISHSPSQDFASPSAISTPHCSNFPQTHRNHAMEPKKCDFRGEKLVFGVIFVHCGVSRLDIAAAAELEHTAHSQPRVTN